jgi:hypothetical protein
MPRRSAVARESQIELPFDAPPSAAMAQHPAIEPTSRRRTRTQPGPSTGTNKVAVVRTSPSLRRPLQPVPRLLVTRKEAAASLGMSLATFERRVQPVIKLVPCGQLVLVPLRELERWCDEHAHYLAGGV